MLQFAVFADFTRPLSEQERSWLFQALDATVPGSGCVGRQRGRPNDEMYFSLAAPSEAAAIAQATSYMIEVLHKAALDVEYALELQLEKPCPP